MNLSAFTIVCNGALLIEQNVRANLSYCDRVVVVEGATNREAVELGIGTRVTGGSASSTDGTIEILQRLQKEFPQKLRIHYAGAKHWPNKTRMCDVALGDCLEGVVIQSDYDEFWHPWQVSLIRTIMESEGLSEMEFFAYHFWASPDTYCKIDRSQWGNNISWRRVFLYTGSERWVSHEPPIMRRKWDNVMEAEDTRALGLIMTHLSYCHDSQILYKEKFYNCPGSLLPEIQKWRDAGLDLSKAPKPMMRYYGEHPINVDFLRTPPGPRPF